MVGIGKRKYLLAAVYKPICKTYGAFEATFEKLLWSKNSSFAGILGGSTMSDSPKSFL